MVAFLYHNYYWTVSAVRPILALLVDHSICHGIPVNPVPGTPRSGCGVDRYSMADNSIVKQSKDIYALKRFISAQKKDIDVPG